MKDCKIQAIELFQFDGELMDERLPGHSEDCICGLLAITTNDGGCSLIEFQMHGCNLKGDIVQWTAVYQRMKGLTLDESMDYIHQKQDAWGMERAHLMESALISLAEQLDCTAKGITNRNCAEWNRAYLFDHSQAYVSF
ncbi:hypothetical protein [Paenibacillus sp. CF384]|uniref:hypothetical protein n=1 Tax=Paenibacillus sp. CF384 TaxID=1884382 RepID=UPI000898E3A3|nr:hypothetical protein [Paenibacillus sp. CF384]SDX96538.1 hypothetical protein SAMN05518855_103213 [Paenibacillus sp. CF384]